ncbi:MAG: hypothetical protein RMA76_35605 [Deltaproteobacteria bacterium]
MPALNACIHERDDAFENGAGPFLVLPSERQFASVAQGARGPVAGVGRPPRLDSVITSYEDAGVANEVEVLPLGVDEGDAIRVDDVRG